MVRVTKKNKNRKPMIKNALTTLLLDIIALTACMERT